jgi:hypothetical protein
MLFQGAPGSSGGVIDGGLRGSHVDLGEFQMKSANLVLAPDRGIELVMGDRSIAFLPAAASAAACFVRCCRLAGSDVVRGRPGR